jgi:hypothetical protein
MEIFESLFCCLTLINDENLKKSKQKKSVLFLKNNILIDKNISNIYTLGDSNADKVKHYFDNSCFIRTDNNNNKDNTKEKVDNNNNKIDQIKEKVISKKLKRSGSSELNIEKDDNNNDKNNDNENNNHEKKVLDLNKEKELFRAKFEKAFNFKGKPREENNNNNNNISLNKDLSKNINRNSYTNNENEKEKDPFQKIENKENKETKETEETFTVN